MIKPAGLARFKRSMITKYSNPCIFCGASTTIGVDYAFLNSAGKWLASCATCATSLTEQCKGVVRSIGALDLNGADTSGVTMPDTAVLTTVLAGEATDAVATEMLRSLIAVRREVKALVASTTPAQPAPEARTDLAPGLYVVGPDGEWASFWRVTLNRAGTHTYAMRLGAAPVEGQPLVWDFVKGGMRDVRRGRPATEAEIAALGQDAHYCCFCSTELTNREPGCSVDRGYGPICAKKYGLPWGEAA